MHKEVGVAGAQSSYAEVKRRNAVTKEVNSIVTKRRLVAVYLGTFPSYHEEKGAEVNSVYVYFHGSALYTKLTASHLIQCCC